MSLTPQERSEDNCAYIRRKVAERGWTWNVVYNTYKRLSPDLGMYEKLQLYGELIAIKREEPETEVCDAVLATETCRSDVPVQV